MYWVGWAALIITAWGVSVFCDKFSSGHKKTHSMNSTLRDIICVRLLAMATDQATLLVSTPTLFHPDGFNVLNYVVVDWFYVNGFHQFSYAAIHLRRRLNHYSRYPINLMQGARYRNRATGLQLGFQVFKWDAGNKLEYADRTLERCTLLQVSSRCCNSQTLARNEEIVRPVVTVELVFWCDEATFDPIVQGLALDTRNFTNVVVMNLVHRMVPWGGRCY